MARLKPWEVSNELWAVIEPLLPKHERRFRHPGRKRLDDRLALQGILFVLHTGIAWEHLPQELGYGSAGNGRYRPSRSSAASSSSSRATPYCSTWARVILSIPGAPLLVRTISHARARTSLR
jgi:hypothetical protein